MEKESPQDEKIDPESETPFLKDKREELKNLAFELKAGKVESKMEKMVKFLRMIELSSTIKILKSDYIPEEIIPHVYIGTVGSATNLKQLEKNKISHIICCAATVKSFFPDKFKYLNLDILDSDKADIKQHFAKSNEFIDEAIKNNGNVLVHCHAGMSRSSTILIAYLIKSQKMKYNEALILLKSKREKVNPNSGFAEQLKEYEKEIMK